MKTVTHNGQTCIFEEEGHTYTIQETGQVLTSGTTFIKQFHQAFDGPKVAKKIAAKRGTTPEVLLAEWKEKGERASLQGSMVHEYAQWIYSDIDGPPYVIDTDNRVGRLTVQLLQACDKLREKGFEPVEAEKIIFSARLGIAGMIDLLMIDPAGRVVVLDWKSNEKLTTNNSFETCFPPIEHLEYANLNLYALQLSLYQFILETENYFPVGQEFKRLIVHLTEDNHYLYAVKFLEDEIESLLI